MGSPFRTGASPVQVAIGDINSDGINDVVTTNYKSASISIFLMGKQGVVSQYSVKVGNQPEGVAVADVNGDGKNEILVTNNGDNTISIIKPGK
jgi:DNA-binding beta-propeller fold protein YncE